MNRLTKGCFGHEFKFINVPGFEFLRCGQMRSKENFGHNSGWYNKNGEKIGWGDLDVNDIQKIMRAIQQEELFITLGEQDSFWKFVTNIGPIGSMHTLSKNEQEPGIDYVAEKSRFIIASNELFCNAEEFLINPGEKEIRDGITFTSLTITQIKKLMKKL